MKNALKKEIKRLSKKAFQISRKRDLIEQKYRDKFTKRTGLTAQNKSNNPKKIIHKHFDPRYCARNANFLSKTIWYKVLNKTYEPIPAINYMIPKPNGQKRSIMAFSIPDAALANIILKKTRNRNLKRLSPHSYAYHPTKNVFDAIIALRTFKPDGKLFAVQIDFEKYFDSISTTYLLDVINDSSVISLTPHERYIFKSFLQHSYAQIDDYKLNNFKKRRVGTPQGSSVSLLLSNLANNELDVLLLSEAGKFVRFADDIVALCSNYQQAQRIENCFYKHCKKVNLK